MKLFGILLILLFSLALKSQEMEDYYSENYHKANWQNARTPAEQIEALGPLAIHYNNKHQDSLANLYMRKMSEITDHSNDNVLKGRSQFWALRFKNDTIKGKKFLVFAKEHKQMENIIVANLFLSYHYIHSNHFFSEKYVMDAEKSLDEWKTDTLHKDSVRIELYYQQAHINLHRLNGIKIAHYGLALQDIADRHPITNRRVHAMICLTSLYGEWEDHQKDALPWFDKLFNYYKENNKPNHLLYVVAWYPSLYNMLGNKEKAIEFIKLEEKLSDSLDVFGFYKYWLLFRKKDLGLITYSQFIQTLDNHFGNRLFLHQGLINLEKAEFHLWETKNLDSVWYYMSKAKKAGEHRGWVEDEYDRQKKNYPALLQRFKKLEKEQKEGGLAKDLLGTYNGFWQLYETMGNYKPAFEYYRKARRLRDSLNKLKDDVGVVTMNLQKQADIKQAVFDEEKRLQGAEQEKTAYKNKIRSFALLAGLLVLLLIAGILWRSNRRKQKDKLKIEQAYNDLKSTQQQLIQSEKMASLGELTAGIAHEIQNPLNFVNNFSEVNNELIEEVKNQKSKLKNEELDELLNDIFENNEKINHHGKRADAIVKGMLQHSRSSSGQKEPTDINALCDEYLRLAYHGLRAKDKSFNATTETEFDNSIGKVNVNPQEIGRVILNLINNAFYAVHEKAEHSISGYAPTVTVSTTKLKDTVEIKVKDNGNGIPQKILEKIFQPFFTTKPTGQGTGLGLSLAYDIITKGHGGKLKVETKEDEGSEFIIQFSAT